jgi:hypothetical protein
MLPAMFDVGSDQLRMARRPLAALDFEIKGQNFLRIGIELAEGDVRDIEPAPGRRCRTRPDPSTSVYVQSEQITNATPLRISRLPSWSWSSSPQEG